ncbi:zip homologous protein 1-like isoform X2 [Aphidius gifuensis]|uniref:zip homologous protein 1-like isoform X2 n=1 Tax=Aphidius gifuensis TaxID=684658 RepID=UPI001CDB992F|nr:zip homologous protein 1-like isoform X2 [Aphidius gifuensis]
MEINGYRCNNCATSMEKKERQFYITQCGHLFCQKCNEAAKAKCPVCHAVGVQSLILKKPLPSAVSSLFKNSLDQIDQTGTILKFQFSQQLNLSNQLEILDKKYERIKKVHWQLMKQAKPLMEKNKKLKMIINSIQSRYHHNTPPTHDSPMMVDPSLKSFNGSFVLPTTNQFYDHSRHSSSNQLSDYRQSTRYLTPSSSDVTVSPAIYSSAGAAYDTPMPRAQESFNDLNSFKLQLN